MIDTERSLNQEHSAEADYPEGAGIPGKAPDHREKKLALLALLLLVPAPSLGVALSMMIDGTQGTTLGKASYFLSKVWILVLPIVWLIWVDKVKLRPSPPWPARFSVGACARYVGEIIRYPFGYSPALRGGFGIAAGLGLLFGGATHDEQQHHPAEERRAERCIEHRHAEVVTQELPSSFGHPVPPRMC